MKRKTKMNKSINMMKRKTKMNKSINMMKKLMKKEMKGTRKSQKNQMSLKLLDNSCL